MPNITHCFFCHMKYISNFISNGKLSKRQEKIVCMRTLSTAARAQIRYIKANTITGVNLEG